MGKKLFSLALGAMLFALSIPAQAQKSTKIPLIGYLEGGPLSAHGARIEAFRQGLRELSYEEGKNIVIEWRFADGKVDRLPALAAELLQLKVAVIVTGGSSPTRAAKEATSSIPIVMAQDNDPVATGVVASLARPGGNIAGLSNFAPELSGKRLEILREVVPKLSRVTVLGTPTGGRTYSLVRKDLEPAANAFGVKLQFLNVLEPKDIETAFRAAANGRTDGVMTLPSALLVSQRAQIVELAAKNRLPAIYHHSQFAGAGGLMFYGVNVLDLDRRAATYVDKILKGRTPADLPVEQPMKFEFIINLKAAKQIGLTVPPNVLVRADKVIR
ncbi:MAG: ABC transporter substrate-binding protein [Deltaproteobacteria bacterium]|nr:ABC transporter substrate-binding protein [Deltaproteobacteria bacterium]